MSRAKRDKEPLNIGEIKDQILDLLNNHPKKTFDLNKIVKKLEIRDKSTLIAISDALESLEESGQVQVNDRGGYKAGNLQETITGTVDFVNPRHAFIISPDTETDVMVKAEDLKYAMDGDTVKVMVHAKSRPGKRAEGEVVEIIKRSRSEFVGRLELSTRYAFVVPDNKKMHYDIFVKLPSLKNAKNNDKVIVEITEWPGRDKNPSGEIINILGPAGDNDAEIHSIMAEFGLPFEFEKRIEAAAAQIAEEISPKEITKRRDMREIFTITIDPEDAKDFDDAISLKHLENGNYEIGVHIADVAHYVKPDTPLDQEAYNRATSVYLVDRTIPMLPEKLSNNLCSLRPHEDKLTFSAIFEIDSNAKIHKEWFGRTIIHSDRRYSYEEAQERIESQEGDFAKELVLLNQIALKLRAQRFLKGSVNFETTEVKFKLDEKGKPLGVIPKIRKDSHKMIEDYMLLANKRVAEYVHKLKGGGNKEEAGAKSKKGKSEHTFVYRTHDYPNPEKLQVFSVFAQKFGHQLKTEEAAISQSLNALMDKIEGKPEQNVLQTLAIRTMAKAKYTTDPKGHFGLAFEHYTHFTSPIRRYPDVMVHRLLQHYLDGGKSVDKENYEEKCLHSSEMEKRAADAERASIKYKQVEFMASVADKVFDGLVSGVTEWGIFVEIVETKCEGMVRMADMDDDFYEFDEKNYRVIGKRNKKIITLGDKVKVTVKATDIDKRTIDLEFVNNERRTASVHRPHKQRN
ncbi:MAG: ribonuclease R [Bacteroidota bacterium]|nr:ribonuclease R [Bacteroidota bacterium]